MTKEKIEGKTQRLVRHSEASSQGSPAKAPTPVSPLYEVQGKQVRQYTNGWQSALRQAQDATSPPLGGLHLRRRTRR